MAADCPVRAAAPGLLARLRAAEREAGAGTGWPALLREGLLARLRELIPGIDDMKVRRYPLPNLWAINLVIEGFLGDGVSSSLRFDAQAKGLGEYARARHINVPTSLLP